LKGLDVNLLLTGFNEMEFQSPARGSSR